MGEQKTPMNWTIRVSGLVQGVGFRPFVWRLATELRLAGSVRNSPAGVEIELKASDSQCEELINRIRREAPPLARVDDIVVSPAPSAPMEGFVIRESGGGSISTGIVPDAATCPECRREIRDPANRRYRYPFANCTHCGPRLSIVESIPYDRGSTTMRRFPLCDACAAEYRDPGDRRFHAEPIACAACGPRIWLEDPRGAVLCRDDSAIAMAVRILRDEGIVAIKGIGGFHLACLAASEGAVKRMRARKNRVAKPFALMAADCASIGRHCDVSAVEAGLLASPAAPIVLLKRKPQSTVAKALAPGQATLGFMVPYSPLHILLFDAIGEDALVMTSANETGEPQTIGNDAARANLSALADVILFHDRDIANRVDDSVVRVDATGVTIIRRARGYAPAPIALPKGFSDAPPVLALGGDLKSAFAFAGGGRATLSQHLGDLDEANTLREFERTIALYRRMFGIAPQVVAIDAHPGYRSSALGRRLALETGATLREIQHHHAHFAACLADNGVGRDDGPSLGIVLDGLGWGPDGTVWGGEFLLGDYSGFERVAWFDPVALPGGDAASREPWRNAFAHVRAAFGESLLKAAVAGTPLADLFARHHTSMIDRMIARGVNSPLSSSAGRLFDAVAAALGVCSKMQTYEGQAAMELEFLAGRTFDEETPWPLSPGPPGGSVKWRDLWEGLIGDLRGGIPAGSIAARFHHTLIERIVLTALDIAGRENISRIVLSGGVFQNRLLLENVSARLKTRGHDVLVHRQVPANDGGIALGQAAVAGAG